MSSRRKNPHAIALGRKGGRAISDAKAAASRANGAKGGRPRVEKPVRPYRGAKSSPAPKPKPPK